MLDHYEHKAATRSDYMRLLRQYSALHYRGDRLNLEENYHPDTGAPIVGLGRSRHYFHSGYVDLILTGLAGIRPRPDDAIDGRVWFMPEFGNGWSSDPSKDRQRLAIDFGKDVRLDRAELAFFSDGARFAAPAAYSIERWDGADWQPIPATQDTPLANGITRARWRVVTTSKIRVALDPGDGRAIRVVEAKLF